MPIANIKSHSPPLSLEDHFKNATVKSVIKQRVSHSTLKNLIRNVRNSAQELSLQGYEEIYEQAHFLGKTLEYQQSKKWDEKDYLIDHALNIAAGKLSMEARKEIRNQYYGRDDVLFPGEVVTDQKVKHFRDIKHLNAKVKEIAKKIDKYIQRQRTLRDSEDAVRQNFIHYKQLGVHLKEVIAEINQAYRDIESSSYPHNKSKLNRLGQLCRSTTDLYDSLENSKR